MNPVSPKVTAATASAASVTTPAVLAMWVLAMLHVPGISMPPPELIGMAVGSSVASLAAFVGGWMQREVGLRVEPPAAAPTALPPTAPAIVPPPAQGANP